MPLKLHEWYNTAGSFGDWAEHFGMYPYKKNKCIKMTTLL
jgi:hypothetical protein